MENKNIYATIALWVSGLALIAAAGIWYVQAAFNLNVQIATAVAIISFALFIYLDPDRARSLFTGRQARYGSNALVMFIAFFGILVVVNFLLYENAQDWGLRWDLTEDQERTLAPETIATLESLESPVLVRAFYTARNPGGQTRARELLDDFAFYAGGNLVYEFINPEEDFAAAQEAGITQDGTLEFSLDGTTTLVTAVSETAFTNAILTILNPGEKGVYFLTGHGEFTIEATGEESLSQLSAALGTKNYSVAALNLLVDPVIPEDAIAIVIAGPLQPVTEPEVALIAEFLDAGGALIVAQEPPALTQFGANPDPVSDYLVESWGIRMGDDLVVDTNAMQLFNSPFYAISAAYGNQAITNDLINRQLITVFPLARSVTIENADIEGVTQTTLVLTSDNSWGETNMESLNDGTADVDEDDLLGPVSLAVAAENVSSGARVVVIGDVDFMSNAAISGQFGNRDLILNAMDWATDQEDLITLTPREVTQRFIVPPDTNTLRLIALGTVILLPGLVLVSGIVVWVSRRRRT